MTVSDARVPLVTRANRSLCKRAARDRGPAQSVESNASGAPCLAGRPQPEGRRPAADRLDSKATESPRSTTSRVGAQSAPGRPWRPRRGADATAPRRRPRTGPAEAKASEPATRSMPAPAAPSIGPAVPAAPPRHAPRAPGRPPAPVGQRESVSLVPGAGAIEQRCEAPRAPGAELLQPPAMPPRESRAGARARPRRR